MLDLKKGVLLISLAVLLKKLRCAGSTARGWAAVAAPCSVGSQPRGLVPLIWHSSEFTEFLNLKETHISLPVYLYQFTHINLYLVYLSKQCNSDNMSKYCTMAWVVFSVLVLSL